MSRQYFNSLREIATSVPDAPSKSTLGRWAADGLIRRTKKGFNATKVRKICTEWAVEQQRQAEHRVFVNEQRRRIAEARAEIEANRTRIRKLKNCD